MCTTFEQIILNKAQRIEYTWNMERGKTKGGETLVKKWH